MSKPQTAGVCVFAPTLSLTVTVEAGREDGPDEIHLHPGGQGFWVARMLRHLGEHPVLCGPVGGESGAVICSLIEQWGVELAEVAMGGASPATIQDRRSGERTMVAETPPSKLARHEFDDAYGALLEAALGSQVCVVTGQVTEVVPNSAYKRLGHDLGDTDVRVVADMHGDPLEAFLEGGPIDVLKISDDELQQDGLLDDTHDEGQVLDAIDDLRQRGASNVVVSRADRPSIAHLDGTLHRVCGPRLEAADFRGAGDSMTAGLAAALRRGLGPVEALQLAAGAGAANVTRHGLGSAAPDLVARLAERVVVEAITPATTR